MRILPIARYAVLGVVTVALAWPAAAQEPSLGDLARRNKSEKKARRVITDEDMPTKPAETAPAPAAAVNSTAGSAENSADQKPAPSPEGETKPAEGKPAEARAKELQEKMERLKADEAGFKKTAEEAEQRIAGTTDDFRREMYQRVLQNSRANAAQVAEQIRQTEQQMQSLGQQKEKPAEGEQAPQ